MRESDKNNSPKATSDKVVEGVNPVSEKQTIKDKPINKCDIKLSDLIKSSRMHNKVIAESRSK